MKMYFRTIKGKCHPRVWRPRARVWLALVRPIPYARCDPRVRWPRARAWLERQEPWRTTLQTLAIILGIGVAIWHVCMMDSIDKRRWTIEAVRSIKQVEFAHSYVRLQSVAKFVSSPDQYEVAIEYIYSQGNKVRNQNRLIDDVNRVLGAFEYIWLLCEFGITDREIIFKGISADVRMFSIILEKLSPWVPHRLENLPFKKLLAVVNKREWKEEWKHRL